MSNERDDLHAYEDLPGCPNCGSDNVERTPAMQSGYRCIDCGTEFDEIGKGVILE